MRFVCYLLYKESGAGLPVKLALAAGRGRGIAPPLRGGGFLIALFSRWVAMHGRLQRAAYMPPLRTNPLYSLKYKVAGGVADFVCCGTPLLLSATQFAGNHGRWGCYLQHNSRRWGCYRQHSLGVVIHGTVWFCGAGVVIPDTIQNRCYSRHISAFCAKNRVVIGGTIAFGVVILGTIRQGC